MRGRGLPDKQKRVPPSLASRAEQPLRFQLTLELPDSQRILLDDGGSEPTAVDAGGADGRCALTQTAETGTPSFARTRPSPLQPEGEILLQIRRRWRKK